MANRKGFYIFLTSILCLVAVIFSVTFAYSYFVFDTRESEEKPKVLVDDIYENYNLTSEGTLQEDLYTVYFMAQPIVANTSSPIDQTPSTTLSTNRNSGSAVYNTTYGSGGKYDGFFESPTEIEADDPALGNTSVTTSSVNVAGEDIYYLKKAENVFQGLTTDLLDAVGRPLCYKADNGGWNGTIDSNYFNSTYDLTFVGWSNNKGVASTDGYASQADFHIVDTRTPLSVYDTEDDGSKAKDRIIYLYAIYTSGKDYSKTGDYPNGVEGREDRYDAVNIRMYDKGNPNASGKTDYWPTREVTSEGREYFAFKNLSISDEQINQNMSFGISAAPVNDIGWDNDWLDAGGGESDPKRYGVDWGISNPGHYNIYVFVFCDRDHYEGRGDSSRWWDGHDNTVLTEVTKEYSDWPASTSTILSNFLEDKNIVSNGNSGLVSYSKEKEESDVLNVYGPSNHLGGFYFYVERIYEFKMLGGNKETFDYDNTSLNYFFDQDGSNTNFEAHNVFFNNMGIEYTYPFEDGSTLTTTHAVFGVVHEKTFPTYKIELTENADIYLEPAVEGTDYTLSEGSPHSAILNGKLFKMTFTGYYDFRITVEYSSGEISRVILDIDVRHSDMFIKITDKDLVDRDTDMFIIHDDFDTNYQRTNNDGSTTRLLFDSIGIYTNNYISGDWEFNQYFEYSGGDWVKLSTPKVVTLNDIVNMLENIGLNLTSHLTKNVIPRSTILDPESPYLVSKSYLWYVS